MRNHSISTLLAVIALSVAGCKSKKETEAEMDRAAIREAVLEFNQNPQPREPGENHQHVINTTKGWLIIASREWKTDENGNSAFAGPSRPTGFYLYPRMEWAENPQEATRLLLADYEAGNCAKAPQPEKTK